MAIILSIAMFVPSQVSADSYTSIVAFGDSLSDNGPADGYGIQRFTNGPTWVEYLANPFFLNVPLLDLAYGGATTGYTNPWALIKGLPKAYWFTGLQWQVDTYLKSFNNVSSSTTLVTIWSGGNDFFFLSATPRKAVEEIVCAINKLARAGYQNFLIPNLPNIGATPWVAAMASPIPQVANAFSLAFDLNLRIALAYLTKRYPTDQFFTLDTYTFLQEAMADPEAYGFNSVADIFWTDGFHPSTQAQELIADMALNQLGTDEYPPSTQAYGLMADMAGNQAVPLPSTLLLLGSGLLGLSGWSRFRRG